MDKKTLFLSELKIGQKAKIVSIDCENVELKRHLLDMGLTTGTIVLLKKKAPFGDPIDIELRGYELCVRKNDMTKIQVEVVL